MANYTITASLNGGDAVTSNNNLIFKIYDGSDDSLIDTTGSHVTDSDVTVSGDTVTITNVLSTATSFKISAVDEAGNEGALSDAEGVGYYLDIDHTTLDAIKTGVAISTSFEMYIHVHEWKGHATGKYIAAFNESSNNNGHISVKNQYNVDQVLVATRDDTSAVYGGTVNMSDGLPHTIGFKFINGGDDVEIYGDNKTLLQTRSLSNFDFSTVTFDFVIGAFNESGALGTSFILDSFEINGELFACNEGSGTTVTGDLGTVCTFNGSPTWIAK